MIEVNQARMAGIYKITQRNTNRVYVGMSFAGIAKRWGEHISRLLNNGHDSRFQTDFDLYGISSISFEIIEFMPYASEAQLKNREQYWIDLLKEQGVDLYNTSKEIYIYSEPLTNFQLEKEWYTVEELMKIFGAGRQRISIIAKSRKWRYMEVPSTHGLDKCYFAADIQIEVDRRISLGL